MGKWFREEVWWGLNDMDFIVGNIIDWFRFCLVYVGDKVIIM